MGGAGRRWRLSRRSPRFIILLSLWNHAMQTLANVVVGTLLTLIIGIAIGIQTAQ